MGGSILIMWTLRLIQIVNIVTGVTSAVSLLTTKDHCLSLAGDKRCEVCEEGFFVDPDTGNCHQQGLPGCLVYERNRNTCLEWAGEGEVAARALQTACPSLQYPLNGACVPLTNPVGCATSSGTADRCAVCQDLYYLIKSGTCTLGTVANCAKYAATSNTCTQCAGTFLLIKKACVTNNALNCQTYNARRNTCSLCNSLYYLVNSGCLAITEKNCKTSGGLVDVCTFCSSGFYLTAQATCLPQEIIGCSSFVENKNECAVCRSPYVPNGVLCQAVVTGCATYNADQTFCSACNSLLYLAADKLACPAIFDTDCDKSDGVNDWCVTCKSTFFLNTALVPPKCETQSIPGCLDFVDNKNECAKCRPDFDPDGVVCKPRLTDCYVPSASDPALCDTCDSLFYLRPDFAACLPLSDKNCRSSLGRIDLCDICQDGIRPQKQPNLRP